MKKLTKHLLLLAFVMAFAVSMAIVGGTAKRNEVFAEDEQSVSVPTKFTGTNVALDGGVIFNFHTDATTGDGSYVLVQFNGDQYALTENVGGTFKFYGIAPQQMGDALTAELYTAADEKVATLAETSVKATLESLLAMTQSSVGLDSVQYRAMKETVVDLLNYGASAQNYTNYKTDSLVNADLSEQDASLATAKKLNATSHRALSANNTMWRGANVIFDSRIGLMFAFKTADDNTGEESELEGYTVTIDGEEVTPEWRQSQKFWIARKKFINITEMNTAITARIHADADGEATENDQTVTYSISSYVAAKGSSEEPIAVMVNNMYKNAYAAVAYSQVSYDAPSFDNAGSVTIRDAKGFDFSDSLYEEKELPQISTEDYTTNNYEVYSTLDVSAGETSPVIYDVYTYYGVPTTQVAADNCVKIGDKVYTPTSYVHATEDNEKVTVDYESGAYTVTFDGVEVNDLRPYKATLTVLGTATITRATPLALNKNVTIGRTAEAVEPAEGEQAEQVDEKAANITYVNQGTGDGITLASGCTFNILNATLNMVGTQNCTSAFYASSGAVNVSTDGELNVDNHYSAPVYTSNNVLTVSGGSINSSARDRINVSQLRINNGGSIILASGLNTTATGSNVLAMEILANSTLVVNGPLSGQNIISYGNITVNGYAYFSNGSWGLCQILGGTTTINGYLRVIGGNDSVYRCRVGGTLNVFCTTDGTTAVAGRRFNVLNGGVMNVRSYNGNGIVHNGGHANMDVDAGGKLTIEQTGAAKTGIWGGDGGSTKFYIGISGTLIIWNYGYSFGAWNSSEVQMWASGTIKSSGTRSRATLKSGSWGTTLTERPSSELPPL